MVVGGGKLATCLTKDVCEYHSFVVIHSLLLAAQKASPPSTLLICRISRGLIGIVALARSRWKRAVAIPFDLHDPTCSIPIQCAWEAFHAPLPDDREPRLPFVQGHTCALSTSPY